MRERVSDHLRRNVYGLVAIFIALGGSAIAANQAARDSVTSKSIRNGQVKNKDLAADSVDGGKVVDGSLTGSDIDEGSLQLSGAPTGLAGGDLTGSYPNPQVAANSVTAAKVLDGTLTGADVADNSVPGSDLVTDSVGANKIQDGTLTGADVLDRGLDAEDIGVNGIITAFDLGPVPAGGCISVGLTLTGQFVAELGEIIFILPTSGLTTNGLISPPTIKDPPPLPDGVWQVCNLTAGIIDPPPQDYRMMSISP